MTEAYEILFRKSEGKTALGRNRRRWNNDIKIDTNYIEYTEFIYMRMFIPYFSQYNL